MKQFHQTFLPKLSNQEASSQEASAYAYDFLYQLLATFQEFFPNHFLTMSKIEEAIIATAKVLDPDRYATFTTKDRKEFL
jgi:hypothetical protein